MAWPCSAARRYHFAASEKSRVTPRPDIVHLSETVLSVVVALLGSEAIPLHCLSVVLRKASPIVVHCSEIVPGEKVTLLGSAAIPFRRLHKVSLHASALLVHDSESVLGVVVTLLSSEAVPLECLDEVSHHAEAVLVQVSDIVLGIVGALFGRESVPRHRFAVVPRYTFASLMHNSEVVLGDRVALRCREAVPLQRLAVALWQVLRLCIALLGQRTFDAHDEILVYVFQERRAVAAVARAILCELGQPFSLECGGDANLQVAALLSDMVQVAAIASGPLLILSILCRRSEGRPKTPFLRLEFSGVRVAFGREEIRDFSRKSLPRAPGCPS